ncbi:MAG: NUDIX domain-containing protein [bacterium]
MKRKGVSIIFINDNHEVLLLLRDNKTSIPYPNMWDLPGGHVETGEKVEFCIIREMEEEMGITLKDFQPVSIIEFKDRIEYTFWKRENLDINTIDLQEGQCLKWFTREEAAETKLAYGFNEIIEDFFSRKVYE